MIPKNNKLPLKWHGFIGLAGKDIEPMTPTESETMIMLVMAEQQENDMTKMQSDFGSVFGYQVLNKRLEAYGIAENIAFTTKVLVTCLSKSPGDAVMWAFTLAYIYAVENKAIDIGTFVTYFPMGFPTDEARERVWDAQKTETCANMVDNFDNWPKKE